MTEYTQQIWNQQTGEMEITTITIYESWDNIKIEREHLLKESDYWLLADRYSTLSEEQQNEIVSYRQALRDITDYYDETDEDSYGADEARENFPSIPLWMME